MSLVEIHDPDKLFPLIEPTLHGHLPLQDFHWKSASRPARSIGSLHIDFVSSLQDGGNELNTAKNSEDSAGEDQSSRRHQVLGLRATSLLRIYVLRCDDRETYKASKRNEIRQWLASHDEKSGKALSKQSGHDAGEWMILHVVVPHTDAATESRWTQSALGDDESLQEKSRGKGKWPGKKPRTVLEKVRGDFSTSSKSEPDRVAQVRLRNENIAHLANKPEPGTESDYKETDQECRRAWKDFIDKLGLLILRSFDTRVTKYEDDIAERQAQRSLPGWNFCTFFVLKEGLACLFESVGLTQDVLAIYDELAVDLESICRMEGQEGEISGRKTFEDSTDDFRELLMDYMDSDTTDKQRLDLSNFSLPFNARRKGYRELIASNKISMFDFKSYIVSRQHELLLRLALRATAKEAHAGSGQVKIGLHRDFGDLAALLKIYENMAGAIPSLARELGRDLCSGANFGTPPNEAIKACIDQVVAAWTFAATAQVLEETDFTDLLEAPVRARSSKNAPSMRQISNQDPVFDQAVAVCTNEVLRKTILLRADMCLQQRAIIKAEAQRREWALLEPNETTRDDNLGPSDPRTEDTCPDGGPQVKSHQDSDGLKARRTLLGIQTFHRMRDLYQDITYEAAWLYCSAGRKRSTDALIADLGILRFIQNDATSAAVHFGCVAANDSKKFETLEGNVLEAHMASLKMLNRRDDYIKAGLRALENFARMRKCHIDAQSMNRQRSRSDQESQRLIEHASNGGLAAELASYSHQLTYDVTVSMSNYFTEIKYEHFITLYDHKDGFRLGLDLRQLISDRPMTVDAVEARLLRTGDGQDQEIWLATKDEILKPSLTRIWLHTNVSVTATFVLDKIRVRLGRIAFDHQIHEKVEKSEVLALLDRSSSRIYEDVKGPFIKCFPRHGALQTTVTLHREIRLGEPRALELHVDIGFNKVTKALISLKSGTAGLRLLTSEATALTEGLVVVPGDAPGILHTESYTDSGSNALKIDYAVDGNPDSLQIRVETTFTTDEGNFHHISEAIIKAALPLEVAVEDIFKKDVLYLKFLLRSTPNVPTRVVGAPICASETFTVRSMLPDMQAAIVPQQFSLPVTFQLQQSSKAKPCETTRLAHLQFTIQYRSVVDELEHAARALFVDSVTKSPLARLTGLLVSHFTVKLRLYYSTTAIGLATSSYTCRLPTYQAFDWRVALRALPRPSRAAVRTWLQRWHETNTVINLSNIGTYSNDFKCLLQVLHIDVDVPSLQYLHIASITPAIPQSNDNNCNAAGLGARIQVIGRPLSCILETRYTRRWDKYYKEDSNETISGDTNTFTYQILVDSGMWLLSGKSHGIFTAPPEESTRIALTLIPLRAGILPLPAVNIGLATDTIVSTELHLESGRDGLQKKLPIIVQGTSPTTETSQSTPISAVHSIAGSTNEISAGYGVCETDCITSGESLRVIEGWREVCVALDGAPVKHDETRNGAEGKQGNRSNAIQVLDSLQWQGASYR